MTNEIKEILEYIKEGKIFLNSNECKILLDYITNLQEENGNLKEKLYNITTMTVCGDRKQIKSTAQYKLNIAEDRIDKAIEYIEWDYDKNEEIIDYTGFEDFYKHLLDILKGEDNE